MYNQTVKQAEPSGRQDENNKKGRLKICIEQLWSANQTQFATFTFSLDEAFPLPLLKKRWDNEEFQYYWEHPRKEFKIAAGNSLNTITASGEDRFQEVNSNIKQLKQNLAEFSEVNHPKAGMLLLGGFSFYDNMQQSLWNSFEPAYFVLPKWIVMQDGQQSLVTFAVDINQFEDSDQLYRHIIEELEEIHQLASEGESDVFQSEQSSLKNKFEMEDDGSEYQKWASSVEKAKNLIAADRFKKIVLARQQSVSHVDAQDAIDIVYTLRQRYQNCYTFLVHQPGGSTFLGSSPERLGSFQNNILRTEALAGSIKRGNTSPTDADFARNLFASSKNQREHQYVVKDIESRLRPFAEDISREKKPQIKKLSNVQHLYTPIRAQLKHDINQLKVLEKLHPTSAVGGYPWNDAAPYLQKLERFERGWYAGPVGWLDGDGSGEFAVAIRSGLLTQSQAYLYAGCGIVEDSDALEEWRETNLKLRPMLSAIHYG